MAYCLRINYKMNDSNSKTENFLIQNSYRKHRQRLADIRHNSTSNDFKLPPRHKAEDKKRMLMQRIKHDQVQSQNSILQQKLVQINQRTNGRATPKVSIQPVYTQLLRYDSHDSDKIQIEEGFNQEEKFKLIIPGQKVRAYSFNSKTKNHRFSFVKDEISNKQHQTRMMGKKYVYSSSSKKRSQSFNTTFSQKQFGHNNLNLKKDKVMFNQPERNQQRQVLHKRTIILSPNQSSLLELSLLQDRMLIAAYMMGMQNNCIKEILSAKKTQQIMRDYHSHYDQFCCKISLEKLNNEYRIIRLPQKETSQKVKDKISSEDKAKEKVKLQNEFLKRNYYTLLKNEQEAKSTSKDKPSATHQKVQEIVQRLAAPKKYLYKVQQKHNQVKNVQIGQISKPPMQSKVSIHYEGQKLPYKNNITKNPVESTFKQSQHDNIIKQSHLIQVSLKRTDSVDINSPDKGKTIQNKSHQAYQQDYPIKDNDYQQEDVEYLDGEEYGQHQFQNPSTVPKSINNSSHISHKTDSLILSSVTKPIQQGAKNKAQIQNKLEPSQEYGEQFQQQQNYEESFQVQPNPSDIKKNSQAHLTKPTKKITQSIVQEQYAQEFDT